MLFARTPIFDPARASFETHLNYVKRLAHLLASSQLTVNGAQRPQLRQADIVRFKRLYTLTNKSIRKDMELAREDSGFAVIAAPWFPVKCYYALYYLESLLCHMHDGCAVGFSKGGHTGIRRKIAQNINQGLMVFSDTSLNTPNTLESVLLIPAIAPGRNTRTTFWSEDECTGCVLKKLTEYKIHDAKVSRKWNLLRPAHRAEKAEFISREQIALLDFFYWYRIKANYKDFDYIDFENGITEQEVLDYLENYYRAYFSYKNLLIENINRLAATP